MSVIEMKDPRSDSVRAMFLDDHDCRCFSCSERVSTRYAVFWHGHETIVMHPDCARRLGQAFIRDGMNAEFLEHGDRPGALAGVLAGSRK